MILLCGGCSLAWWSSVGILACLLAANVLHCYSKLAVGVEGLLGPLGARRGRFLFPLVSRRCPPFLYNSACGSQLTGMLIAALQQSNATGQLLPPIVGEAVLVPAGCRGAWLSTVHHPLNTAAALMLSPLWLFQLLFHRCCFSADSCGSAVRLTELRGDSCVQAAQCWGPRQQSTPPVVGFLRTLDFVRWFALSQVVFLLL
ncbi:uncharacterized protein LOC122972190 isoform X2 [Thunnus albacares]|uniref:uncharacterized protein LOC122972190 isoform X2 n=1 Tax=Thunnus albacares TaxID=8236 RepID=UPI001CF638FE|nr:uncharacterized protein LOC122972190 isoform X2 [Thunnus albacares]